MKYLKYINLIGALCALIAFIFSPSLLNSVIDAALIIGNGALYVYNSRTEE